MTASGADWFTTCDKWAEATSHAQMLSLSFGAAYRGEPALVVSNCVNRAGDTAWRVKSVQEPIPPGMRYLRISFRAASDWPIRKLWAMPNWCNAITWYDAEGRSLARSIRECMAIGRTFSRITYLDAVPEKAVRFAVEFGFDPPDVPPGKSLAFKDLAFAFFAEKPADLSDEPIDLCEPEIRFAPPKGATDGFSLTITDDASAVVWVSGAIAVDGVDVTKRMVRNGDRLAFPAPDRPWADGLHTVTIDILDSADNRAHSVKYFHIGPRTISSPVCRLRKDGMMFVDEKPFFPIGIYGVCRRAFNGNDFDRACADLKAGGFNIVQSYSDNDNPAFFAAARKHGLKTWCEYRTPEDAVFKKLLRDETSCIARYTGDDTADYFSPSVMIDRHESVRAVDPGRLTCQADSMGIRAGRSKYRAYVACTDVFMPEIYSVKEADQDTDSNCVAQVVRAMDQAWRDIREARDVVPHAVWPIIQYFQGWSQWKRFPTREELNAMSFAALVHGANGLILYTYGGYEDPKQKVYNYGVTTTPERWANTTNLATRIATLTPVLMAEKGGRCDPAIVAGPRQDGLGQPAVTACWKSLGDWVYVMAVNATRQKVSVAFALPRNGRVMEGEVKVAWENRHVRVRKGAFRDDFAPYGVHVYRLRSGEVE